MTTALAILIGLLGYEMAIKALTVLKIMGVKVENCTQSDFEELLKDPRFRKYMR